MKAMRPQFQGGDYGRYVGARASCVPYVLSLMLNSLREAVLAGIADLKFDTSSTGGSDDGAFLVGLQCP